MIQLFRRVQRWVAARLRRKQARLIACNETVGHVLDLPQRLFAGQAILVARADTHDWLAFDCPCGRGHQLLMNLSGSRRPRWRMTALDNGAVTLAPSVDSHSEHGRCHFWLREGKVSWVQPPAFPKETRSPLRSDSATFSAGPRHWLTVRNVASPSVHSLVVLSR